MDKLPGRRRSKHEQQLSGSESLSAMGSATLSDPGPVFTVTPSLGMSNNGATSLMPIKKVKGGYKVKYPGKKARTVKTRTGAVREQRKQKAKY
jgi:hypothetical protein